MSGWLKEHPSATTGIVAVIGVAVIVLLLRPFPPPIRFAEFDLDKFSSAITPLLVIAVLIERTLEVYFGITREPKQDELENTKEKADRVLKKADVRSRAQFVGAVAATATTLVPVTEGDLGRVLDGDIDLGVAKAATVYAKASKDVVDFGKESTRIAFIITLGLGVLAAVAGVRVLSMLLLVDAATGTVVLPTGSGLTLFNFLDVLLTAGLLAGGSDGFHHVTSVIRERLETLKKQAKAQAPPVE